jgi:outer membrane protein insertion porin family
MKHKRIAFILVIALALFCAGDSAKAQDRIVSGQRVQEIQVMGNQAISTATIMNRLKMKPGDEVNEAALNNEIRRLYATGYFADVFVRIEDRPEGAIVVFTVAEKPVIGRIEFKGNSKIRTQRLEKRISAKEGDILDFSAASADVSAVRNAYIEQGYSGVDVDYKVEQDPVTGRAVLVFIVREGEARKIRKITFEGNANFPSSELEKFMSTKTAWWWIRKGAFDEEKFQADISRIRNFYRSKGFLDARVTSRMDYSEDGNDMFVTVVIDEGKLYLLGELSIQGELAFPEDEVYFRTKVRSGDPFDLGKIREDVENVRTLYYDRGYMNAEIDIAQKYNASTDRMDLTYNIVAHDVVYVGMVNVIGNIGTKDKVIRREMRLYPGERYDGEKLKKSKERIYNLGYFEDVYFDTSPTSRMDVMDLNVTVKETKTGEFSLGGGYSSVDAFIGFVQLRQRNFDVMNFPTFTGSGQDLTIRAELGSHRTNYFIGWTDPWIFDLPYLFGFDLYRTEQSRSGDTGYGYDETRMGGSLRLGKELTDNLNTGLVYNLEEVKISDIADEATDALKREVGSNFISRITWNLKYDIRDNMFSPTKGFVAGTSIENAGGFIGGDKDFYKFYGYLYYYHSIIENVVLELKGSGGFVQDYGKSDEVPIYERYFAGGARTIRGYKERGVGPRDRGTNSALGGEAILIGNAEVSFPVFKNLVKGAVFFDIGNVWEEADLKALTGAKDDAGFKAGAGVGVRVRTPIGPVKLDWGYPLSDNYDDKKEGQFYFSVTHGF